MSKTWHEDNRRARSGGWNHDAADTSFGQLVFFSESLTLTGLLDRWMPKCPLMYRAPSLNEPGILGTGLLSVLSGHRRNVRITNIRVDGVSS